MWRQTKERVQHELPLPPVTVTDLWLDLSPCERGVYEALLVEIQADMQALLAKGKGHLKREVRAY